MVHLGTVESQECPAGLFPRFGEGWEEWPEEQGLG